MTTYTLQGYQAFRDTSVSGNDIYGFGKAVSYQPSTFSFVSADDQEVYLWFDRLPSGELAFNEENAIWYRLDDDDSPPPDGLSMGVDGLSFTLPSGGESSLSIFEFWLGDAWSGFYQIGGQSYLSSLDSLADVQRFEASIFLASEPGSPWTPGNRVSAGDIVDVSITENDRFPGTEADDSINLGMGDDTLRGAVGDDRLFGGTGNDRLYGDAGHDEVSGDGGEDTIDGGDGDDLLDGGDGDDLVFGSSGADTIFGGPGADDLRGGTGRDEIYGSDGLEQGSGYPDRIDGGDNSDRLYGHEGNDTVIGGRGSDLINGFFSDDALFGDDGNDTLEGSLGSDTLTGGSGTIEALRAVFAFDDFDTDHGWTSQNRTPRLMGDIDGDGAADIVGFGWLRAFSALNDATGGFDGPEGAIDNFAVSQGWTSMDGRLRLLGDADGDGDDDIIGFGINSGFVAFSNGDGTFSRFKRAVENFANAQGWRSDNDTPRVMGDVNGDGIDDIIGFGNAVTFTALGNGDGTFGSFRSAIDNFSRAQGWATNDAFLRLSGDVNGDGMADLVGFGVRGTYTALSRGDGTFGDFRFSLADFGKDQGWSSNDATPRLLADVNGDGLSDIVGFGGSAAFAAFGLGDGTFGRFEAISDDFNRAMGWTSNDALLRSAADIDGDGDDDLIGFSGDVRHQRVGPEFDTFVFGSGDAADVDMVTDFDPVDRLDMAGSGLSPSQALGAASQVGTDVVIPYDDARLVLQDFDLGSLTVDNFL